MAVRRIIYGIVLYMILTYNVLYETHDGMVMLIFFMAASAASFVILLACRFNLEYGYESGKVYGRRRSGFELKYRIRNKAPFPVVRAQLLFEDRKNALTFAVGGHCETSVSKKYSMEHCGCYNIEAKGISLYGFFRVLKLKIANPGVVKVVSLPRLFDVNTEDYLYSMTGIAENCSKGSESSGSEISGVREYLDGDRIKNIHHKLSSRMSSLMVKEFEADEGDEDVYMFYPSGYAGTDRTDEMLELMYNMMYLKLRTKGKVTGYIPSDDAYGEGMRHTVVSEDGLNAYFEKVMDYLSADSVDAGNINGMRIFAPDVTEELIMCCGQTEDRRTALYVPRECEDKTELIACEVVLVSSGGDMV